MSLSPLEKQYRSAIAQDMGLTADELDQSRTLVLAEVGRSGSAMAVAYQVGDLTAIRCDPAIEASLRILESNSVGIGFEQLEAWFNEAAWELVDGGDVHLLLDGLKPRALPHRSSRVRLSRDSETDVASIATLLSVSDPTDVEAAEIDLEELDPLIVGLVDSDGLLGSYASGAVWEEDNQFDDIGVLTRPDLRGAGWGAAVVSAMCEASLQARRIPLYRCNWSRGASKALALSLGFVQVGTLLAYKKPGLTVEHA